MNLISRKLFYSGLLFLFFFQNAFPQDSSQKPKTNLENINILLDASFELLGDRLILNKDKIYLLQINHADNETESYFRSRIRGRFPDYKIISDVNLGKDAQIIIDSLYLDTKYIKLFEKNLLGDKYIQRKAIVRYNCVFAGTDIEGYRFNQSFTDDFGLDDLSLVESNNFFAQGVIPSQSFFAKYLIPSIVVLTSAAAAILFFTVRNK